MANDAVKGDGMNEFLYAILGLSMGILLGIIIGVSVNPTMSDVVTLDNRRCILVYEQDLVHKFCEAK